MNNLSMAILKEVFLQLNGTSRQAEFLAVCGFQVNLAMSTLYLTQRYLPNAGPVIPM